MTDQQKQQLDKLTTEQARLVLKAIEEIEREEAEAGSREGSGCCENSGAETAGPPPSAREREDGVRRDD